MPHTYFLSLWLLMSIFMPSSLFAYSDSGKVHIYKGSSTYRSDILFTSDGKYVYRGSTTYQSDIIATYDGKHIYRGASTYHTDIILTTDADHVYNGSSTYSSNILLTWDMKIPTAVLLAIIL